MCTQALLVECYKADNNAWLVHQPCCMVGMNQKGKGKQGGDPCLGSVTVRVQVIYLGSLCWISLTAIGIIEPLRSGQEVDSKTYDLWAQTVVDNLIKDKSCTRLDRGIIWVTTILTFQLCSWITIPGLHTNPRHLLHNFPVGRRDNVWLCMKREAGYHPTLLCKPKKHIQVYWSNWTSTLGKPLNNWRTSGGKQSVLDSWLTKATLLFGPLATGNMG